MYIMPQSQSGRAKQDDSIFNLVTSLFHDGNDRYLTMRQSNVRCLTRYMPQMSTAVQNQFTLSNIKPRSVI